MRARGALWAAALLVASTTWLIEGQSGSPREDAYRHNNLGVAHLERYNFRAAADAFRQALTIDPNLTITRLNLAIARLYDGDHDAASIDANAVVAALPRSPHGHYVAGLIARAANRTADAAAAFQRVLDIDPEDVGTRIQLAQIHTGERRYAEAASLFDAALSREPFNATAAYGLATALVRGGQRTAGEAAMARFQAAPRQSCGRHLLEQLPGTGPIRRGARVNRARSRTGRSTAPASRFVDATGAVFGEDDPRGRVTLFDADRDGDLDALVAASTGLTLLMNDKGRFARPRTIDASVNDGLGAIAGDYDNDGRTDVFVVARAANRLFRQQPDGSFSAVPVNAGGAGLTGAAATAAFADIDHDGDLDIFLSSPNRVLQNNGNGTFSDTAAITGLAGTLPLPRSSRPTMTIVATSTCFLSRLGARLRCSPTDAMAHSTMLPVRQVFQATLGTQPLRRAISTKMACPTSCSRRRPKRRSSQQARAADDFRSPPLRAGPQGRRRCNCSTTTATVSPICWRSRPAVRDSGGISDRRGPTSRRRRCRRRASTSGETATAMAVGDVDADGDYDVIVHLQSGRVRFWRNTQPAGLARPGAVSVRLDARVSNRSAIGAKVELRAGSLRDRFEVSAAAPPAAPSDIVFGLGRRARADVIRVLWPSGVLQAEPDPARATTIVELDRKPSSCPLLFTWTGTRFEFVTDFMGGGEMGAWVAPGIRNVPDPDEYVRLRHDQLSPRNGRYELRMTNELEEALFVDRIQLVAVAHADTVGVFPNEGLRSPSERRPFAIYTTQQPRPPDAAIDHHGHDMLDAVRSIDRRYVDDFLLESVRGYAEMHSLTLSLGNVPSGSPLRLLFTGWTDYAFSSDNVAAIRPDCRRTRRLSRSVTRMTRGARLCQSWVFRSAGRKRLRSISHGTSLRAGGRIEVRVNTTMRVYWDQILMDTSAPAAYTGHAARSARCAAQMARLLCRAIGRRCRPAHLRLRPRLVGESVENDARPLHSRRRCEGAAPINRRSLRRLSARR